MKNNICLILFFLIISCSSKSNLETGIDEIKKQGKTILESNYILNNNLEINNIKKLNLENNTKIVNNWNFPYYNSRNLIPHINFNNKFSIVKSKSYFKFNDQSFQIRNILSTKDKLIYVDDYANLIVLDHYLTLKKKIILNKKIPKKFSAKFSLSIYENILYVSSNLGTLYAIDCENYKILWSNNLGVPFISNIGVNSNSVFVSNVNGKLYSFDRYNGKQIWSYDTGSELFSDSESFKILLHKDKIIFSNSFGYIYCIDLFKNTLLWSFKVPLSFNKYSSENLIKFSNFIADEEFFFFSTNFGKFYKINLNNGAVVWSNNSSFDNFFITIDNMIATTDSNNFFTIYDKMSGKILLKKNIFSYFDLNKIDTKNLQIHSFFLGSHKFFLITNTGYLVSISADDLNILNHIKLSDKIISNLIILTNKIFLIDNKEYIYRIQ